jgi:hypothetical protein
MSLALVGVSVVVSLGFSLAVGFSLAGDLAPARAGEASSVVTVVCSLAFFVGPVFVGTVADLATLRTALATVVPDTALVAVLGSRVGA